MSFSWPKAASAMAVLFALALTGAPARADEPTPAALEIASRLLGEIGLKPSIDAIVPGMLGELERGILASRPELKDALHATLVQLEPEFSKSDVGVLADVAHVLATQMSEQELKDAETFFTSPSGKKYVAAQGPMLTELGISARAWRQQLSDKMLARVREELKKKGFDF